MKLKKIFIYILTFILTIGIITPFMPKKQAKASAGALTLYEILMALIGYVAVDNFIDIDLSEVITDFDIEEPDTTDLVAFSYMNQVSAMDMIGDLIIYESGTQKKLREYVSASNIDIYNHNLAMLEVQGGSLEITSRDMEQISNNFKEYLGVPTLSNEPIVANPSYETNVIAIDNIIEKYNNNGRLRPLSPGVLDNIHALIEDRPYLAVSESGLYGANINFIASSVPMMLYPTLTNNNTNIRYHLVPTVNVNHNTVKFNLYNSSSVSLIENYGQINITNLSDGRANFFNTDFVLNEDLTINQSEFNNKVEYINYDLQLFDGRYQVVPPMYDINIKYDNSLSYKTFLKSKYGIITDADRPIVLDIDNWGYLWQTQELPSMDNVVSTDDVMTRLRTIENIGSEVEKSITNTRILTQAEIDEIETDETIANVIAVQGDIVNNFKGIYAQMPDEVSIPSNILVGLTFVAYVFGGIWTNLGEYAFILVFGCTIGMIAMLIGLGKQIGNSEKPVDKGE